MESVLVYLKTHHQVQVFPGGSRNLKALPGVGRAAVQQLCPGDVVLPWDADLPVAIDHKLGAAILQGWKREIECSGGELTADCHHSLLLSRLAARSSASVHCS